MSLAVDLHFFHKAQGLLKMEDRFCRVTAFKICASEGSAWLFRRTCAKLSHWRGLRSSPQRFFLNQPILARRFKILQLFCCIWTGLFKKSTCWLDKRRGKVVLQNWPKAVLHILASNMVPGPAEAQAAAMLPPAARARAALGSRHAARQSGEDRLAHAAATRLRSGVSNSSGFSRHNLVRASRAQRLDRQDRPRGLCLRAGAVPR